MNRPALALAIGLAIGAAPGPEEAPDATAHQEELARLRKQVGLLERKLARRTATPAEAFRMDRTAGGSDAVDGGPALDEAEQAVSSLMASLQSNWHAPWVLVDSPEEMSRFFARVASGPAIDPTRTPLSVRPPDGATILFPAGRHALDAQALSRFDPFPRELVIEGAGMDRTLLVMNDDIRPTGRIFHLRIKNATVSTNGGRLVRAPGESFTLRLEKCRLLGFDDHQLVSGERGAVFASDCRFEAGYGSRPAGRGSIFDVTGPLLARFERCVFRGPFLEPVSSASLSAQVYADCRFEALSPQFRPGDERFEGVARLEGCSYDYLDARAAPVTRSLSDINDAW